MKKVKMDDLFFGLHTDLHASRSDIHLCEKLSEEMLVSELLKLRPDYVQCDCKGHPGYTSFFSETGDTAPSLAVDNLEIWGNAAKKLGIPLFVHYSGVWDTRAIEKHPAYARVDNREGETSANSVCTLSDYLDERMIPQMLEIMAKYNVAGFWIDGDNWAVSPCYCARCQETFQSEYQRENIPSKKEDEGYAEWLEFHRNNFEKFVAKYTAAVKQEYQDCLVCSNWMYTLRQPDAIAVPVDYLSGDFDPIRSVPRASLEGRFMMTRGLPWNLMQWGFTTYTRDYKDWTLKTAEAMYQEAAVTMSCGGGVLLYDAPLRDGRLVSWHMDEFSKVAAFVRERQEYCQGAQTVPQIAILHSKSHFYKHNHPCFNFGEGSIKPIEGAVALLLENGFSTDIINEEKLFADMEEYPVCVVPEQSGISDALCGRMLDYTFGGGHLIVAGECNNAYFDSFFSAQAEGTCSLENKNQAHIEINNATVPAMGEWRRVKPGKPCVSAGRLLENAGAGEQGAFTGYYAANIYQHGRGKVMFINGPVFSSYMKGHYSRTRAFVKLLLNLLGSQRLISVEAPPYIHVSAKQKGNLTLLHLVDVSAAVPTSDTNNYVEYIRDSESIQIKCGTRKPANVFLAPHNKKIEWEYKEGLLYIKVPEIYIHEIVVIES